MDNILISTIYCEIRSLKFLPGTSLVVQWLRLRAPNVGGLRPRIATREAHALQQRPSAAKINRLIN